MARDLHKFNNPIRVGSAASDPASGENGEIYYNTGSNRFRKYENGAWSDFSSGSVTLTGQVLPQNNILVGDGSNLSADLDTTAVGDILADSTNGLTIKSGVITNSEINASAGIVYSKLSLTGSIVNADINASAAIAYSKLALTGSIVNADIAAGAAIAYSKLAALTANRALQSDGSGFVSVSSVTSTELGYVSGVTSAIQTQLSHKIQDDGSVPFAANQPMASHKLTGLSAGTTAGDSVRYEQAVLVNGANAFTADQPMGSHKLTGLSAGSGAGDSVRYEQTILISGVNAFTADQSMGGFKLTNLADPVSGTDAVNMNYLSARLAGLKPKQSVRAATTVAGTLASSFANGSVIDGVTLATGDRILIKDQAAPADNGIYTVNVSGSPTRATDFDSLSPIDEINGAWVSVQEGTANAGKVYVQFGLVSTLGTDAINFEYFNPIASLIGGDMITFSGSTFSVDLATASGLESTNPGNAAGQLRVKLEASNPSLKFTGSNELAAKLDPAGTITSGASGLIVGVDNSTIAISGNQLIVKSGGITNTQVSASAAIAYSKLAALTANRALQSDGSGFVSVSSVTNTELGYLSGVTSAIQTQLNGKASIALDNLASTAVNADIIPGTNNAVALGSSAKNWTQVNARNHRSDSVMLLNANDGSSTLDVESSKMRRSKDGSNFVEEEYIDSTTLTANTTTTPASLTFALASFEGCEIEYKMKQATSNEVRLGKIRVAHNGTVTSTTDDFNETADVGITASSAVNGANIEISFANAHATRNVTMRADVKRFRA